MAANAEATVTLSLIDRITGPIKRIGARLGAMTRRIGFDKIGAAVGNLGNKIRGLGDGLARTSGRLASFIALLGVGGAGLLSAAYGLAKNASDVGSEIHDIAAKTGLSTESLSEWLHVIDLAGVEAKTFENAITKLGINSVDATKGNKAMAASFKALGVSVKGAGGKMRPMDDILDDTMLALTKIKDPLTRNALAFKIFGKSGAELGKILEDGADGIKAGREEARRLGIVWGGDAADAADALGDATSALMKRLAAFRTFVGVSLIPVFGELVAGVDSFVAANSKLIRSKITDWAGSLVGFVKQLIDPTSQIRVRMDEWAASVASLYAKLQPFIDYVGGPMNATLLALAAYIVGPLVAALATLGVAIVNLGVVFLSTPFGWIVLGIAAVVASVYVLYQKWEEFAAYWSAAWARIKAAFQDGFWNGINQLLVEFDPISLIAKAFNAVFKYFTGIDLAPYGLAMEETLANGFKAGWSAMTTWISEKVTSIGSTISGAASGFFQAGGVIVTALWDGIKSKWGEVETWLRGAMQSLVGWLPESLQEKLGFKVTGDVSGAANAAKAGADMGGLFKPPGIPNVSLPPGGFAAVTSPNVVPYNTPDRVSPAAANQNIASASAGSALRPDGDTSILTNSGNTVNTTLNASINITAAPGADAAAIGAAVRRELDGVNRRAASATQSALSD